MSDSTDSVPETPPDSVPPVAAPGQDPGEDDAVSVSGDKAAREQDARDDVGRQQQAEKDGKGKKRYALQNPGKFGINDHGDYMRIRGLQTASPRNGNQTISDKQLKAILMTAITDKGWSEICFWRGSRLDKQLTARAQSMIATDPGLAAAIRLRDNGPLVVRTSLPEKAPPFVNEQKHARNLEREHWSNVRAQINGLDKARKDLGRGFADAEGGGDLSHVLRAQARALRAEIPGPLTQTFTALAGVGKEALGALKSSVSTLTLAAALPKNIVVGTGSVLAEGYNALARRLRPHVPGDTFTAAPDAATPAANIASKPPEHIAA